MRKYAFVLAAVAGLMSAAVPAIAQRGGFQSAGQDWVAARFSSEAYPQTRSPRAERRAYRSEGVTRSSRATRSSRTAHTTRSTRVQREARRGRNDGGTSMASLTGSYGVGPRPGAWCGWWMRTQLGGGPEYNLAWNWRKYGSHSSGPQVGAVVVWRHHVGMITGQASNGQWIVKSGNDGGRVRERARSVSGAIFRV